MSDDGRDLQRRKILEGALQLVAFEGWTEDMLDSVFKEQEIPLIDKAFLFPNGVRDLLRFSSETGDREMSEVISGINLGEMRIRERIEKAVQVRLSLLQTHREAVRKSAVFLSLPGNTSLGAKLIYKTVDAIWRAIGDNSTDFNFYTKRATLAGVYSSTLLFWLSDDSEDYQKTNAFLERRIANVMQFEKGKAKVQKLVEKLPNPWSVVAAFRYPGRY